MTLITCVSRAARARLRVALLISSSSRPLVARGVRYCTAGPPNTQRQTSLRWANALGSGLAHIAPSLDSVGEVLGFGHSCTSALIMGLTTRSAPALLSVPCFGSAHIVLGSALLTLVSHIAVLCYSPAHCPVGRLRHCAHFPYSPLLSNSSLVDGRFAHLSVWWNTLFGVGCAIGLKQQGSFVRRLVCGGTWWKVLSGGGWSALAF